MLFVAYAILVFLDFCVPGMTANGKQMKIAWTFNVQTIFNAMQVYAKYMKPKNYWHLFFVLIVKWVSSLTSSFGGVLLRLRCNSSMF